METSVIELLFRPSIRSYRTYEEWKHCTCKMLRLYPYVLTVPMRNGNVLISYLYCVHAKFLPYLWGMETYQSQKYSYVQLSSYRTYEEWKLIFSISQSTISIVLTVPMRNGNAQLNDFRKYKKKSSYRTYEEWKLFEKFLLLRFDLVLTVPMRNGNELNHLVNLNWILVLTVPMRNGNWLCKRRTMILFFSFLPYLWGMETAGLIL